MGRAGRRPSAHREEKLRQCESQAFDLSSKIEQVISTPSPHLFLTSNDRRKKLRLVKFVENKSFFFSKSYSPELCEDKAFGKIEASWHSWATCLNGSVGEQVISLFHLCLGNLYGIFKFWNLK